MAEYTYNDTDGQYYDEAGAVVGVVALALQLAELEGLVAAALAAGTAGLVDGGVALADWQGEVLEDLAAGLVAALALAVGGWARTDRAVQVDAAAELARQARYLEAFAADIRSGRLSEAQIVARATLYAGAVWALYQARRARDAGRYGYGWVRNRLTGGDHCAGCSAEAARGWVPVGAMSLPGSRDCRGNCRCFLEYARTPAGVRP